MQGYRFAWIVSAAIVIGPAVAFDLVSGGWLRMVVLTPVMALLGGLLGLALTEERPDRFLSWSSAHASGPPDALTRQDLLRRWSWTTAELVRTSTPLARRLVLVEERRSLLDELERRDPSGFDDWVATLVSHGARPHPRGGGERSWKPGW